MSQHYSIFVGSVLGASEYVADALTKSIREMGDEVDTFLSPDIDDAPEDSIWIICTSTHGAGDLPDNIQPFAEQITNTDLSQVEAYIVGLGDSSYDTYCFGAMTMEKHLIESGAKIVAPALHIDVLKHPIPEDIAVAWLEDQLQKQG